MGSINTNLEELQEITLIYKNFLEDIRATEKNLYNIFEEFESENYFIKSRNNSDSDTYELIKTYTYKRKELEDLFKVVLKEDCIYSFKSLLKALNEYHSK